MVITRKWLQQDMVTTTQVKTGEQKHVDKVGALPVI